MRIFLAASDEARDNSHYLQVILHACGLCCAQRAPLADALAQANPQYDVLVVSGEADAGALQPFLQAGGQVVAIRPAAALCGLAGLKPVAEKYGQARLRLTTPLCFGARGEPLWTLGARTVYEGAPPASVLAYLFEPGDFDSEAPGLFRLPVGEGSLTVFAYDVSLCIARLRQGSPERVGMQPPGDPVPRSIHLHEPNPPHDAGWRPTADLHAALFCDVVKELLGRNAPVPALWHLPEGAPAIVIFSGDEDGSEQSANRSEMALLENNGGAMSLYVIQDGTSMTGELAAQYTARGHAISVHPNLVPTVGQPQAAQIAKAESDVRGFQEKFGQPARTVRNHNTMWPGYLDIPELWQQLGIGMDGNCMATLFKMSPDVGPYININAALPLPFVREDGSLIDVYQQPTHYNDDVFSHPTVGYSQKFKPTQFARIAERILEDAARFYHAPFCVNFHPCNYVNFATEAAESILESAGHWGAPVWSLDQWHDFWRARSSWQCDNIQWNGNRLSFNMHGSCCNGLTLTLPAAWQGSQFERLNLDGQEVEVARVERYGESVVQASLPAGKKTVETEVFYN